MGYKILVTYNTGDSFSNTDGVRVFVEGTWEDEGIAKLNAKAIDDHNAYVDAKDGYSYIWRTGTHKNLRNTIIKNGQRQFWFSPEYSDHCMFLKLDDGRLYKHSNPWCGYFESLIDVEVVDADDNRGESEGWTTRYDDDESWGDENY